MDVVAAASTLLQHNDRRVPKEIRASSVNIGLTLEVGEDAVAATSRDVSPAATQ